MVDRNETVLKGKNGIEKRYEFGEVQVSNADTVTLDSFKATVNLLNMYLMKKSDGSEMTNTHAAGTNVVTIAGAGTDVDCIYMAWGYKA
jgi:hypothetical protein